MQVNSEAPGLIQFDSTTGQDVDFQHIDELFSNADVSHFFSHSYAHLAEVISNIYQHARAEPDVVVKWQLTATMDSDLFCITISDDGQGVTGSIGKRHLDDLTDTAAMRLALSHGSRVHHRGKGLESIIRAVASGQLHSMAIQSGSCLFSATAEGHDYTDTARRQGTEVQLTIYSSGGQL